MRAIIVDDELSMRENLRTLLTIYASDIEIIGEATSVKEGVDLVKKVNPDLAFLDVEMKDGTGFDLLSILVNPSFKVIFVTGHEKFAIKAFKFSAIDYILKPIDPDDLQRAVEKVRNNTSSHNHLEIETLIQNHHTNHPKRIVLNDSQNTYLISVDDIIRLEADVNYTKFSLVDSRQILVSKTLKSFDEILVEDGFFRCHQSHLINLNFFDRYDKSEGGIIYLKNGVSVPISVRKKDELMAKLKGL